MIIKKKVKNEFFFGFISVAVLVLFLGMLSMFAASNVDTTVNIISAAPAITFFTATPTSVNSGDSSLLTWNSTNTTSCNSSDFATGGAISNLIGVPTGALTTATTFTITCSGPGGPDATSSVTVTISAGGGPSYTSTPPTPTVPKITSFIATPALVDSGGSSVLSWTSQDATSCSSPDFSVGSSSNTNGSITLNNITSNKIFNLICTDGISSDMASVEVKINVVPILIANKTLVAPGDSISLSWTAAGAAVCTASGVAGWSGSKFVPSGAQDVVLPSSPGIYVYTLTCDESSTFVTINVGLPPVFISFNSNKTTTAPSDTASLAWDVTGADTCEASGASDWSGNKSLSGTSSITLPDTIGFFSYKLSCSNVFGSISRTININVSTAEKPPIEEQPPMPITNPIEVTKPTEETFGGAGGGIEVTMTTENPQIEIGALGTTKISWTSKGADSCSASGVDGWAGNKPVNGSETVTVPAETGIYTYVLTCENQKGQKTVAYAKITVTEPNKIEGFFNIIESEIIPEAAVTSGEVLQYVPTPSEIIDKLGLTEAFLISGPPKTFAQNVLSTIIAALLLLMVLYLSILYYKNSKNWGYIFDADSGRAISDAKIEIRKASNGEILQTTLSDHKGKFRFILKNLKDGDYIVAVEKRGYLFPSKVFGRKTTIPKLVYLGRKTKLIIKKGFKMKIPIDPISKQI
ncbi:MAG TPA: carboxypeptidase-like regulatory domain-containing protein [Patescibacteria group bacterium]|nr:carboxypeptidase-like regulatory domain-containing protein [Patescibacteria group bacterium]